MRILVTGGTGHLGAWLVKALSEQNNQVAVLTRNADRAAFLNFPGVEVVQGDITSIEDINRAISGAEVVFHLAALSAPWAKDPLTFDRINREGTRLLMEAAVSARVKRVIITSSAGGYGPSTNGIVDENTQRTIPFFNAYERTKFESDRLALEYLGRGPEIMLAVPTRVYGPILDGIPSAANKLFEAIANRKFRFIPGSGASIGNYVYVHDVTDGFLRILEHGKNGESYILGGDNFSYRELYQKIARSAGHQYAFIHIPMPLIRGIVGFQKMRSWFGKEPQLTPDWLNKLKYNYEISVEKAIRELGYSPSNPDYAIEETVSFFRNNDFV